jgi:hypothetical protein
MADTPSASAPRLDSAPTRTAYNWQPCQRNPLKILFDAHKRLARPNEHPFICCDQDLNIGDWLASRLPVSSLPAQSMEYHAGYR